jgi:hypothetical protein
MRRGRGRPEVRLSADEIRKLYWDENKTLHETAELLGVCLPTLRKEMDRLGIEVRATTAHQPNAAVKALYEKRNSEVIRMRQNGLSLGKIGRKFNLSRQRIAQILVNSKVEGGTRAESL